MTNDQKYDFQSLLVNQMNVFKGSQHILSKVSFRLFQGQILGIMGESGVGKSTLLRALIGLEKKAQIDLRWQNQNHQESTLALPRFGWVPQECGLFPHLTVRENICFSAPYLTQMTAKKLNQRLLFLSERLSLSKLLTRFPQQLSGGQKQRVALARALFSGASVLLLDEPLAHLDQKARIELRNLITTLVHEEKIACIWVTHDPEELLEVSDIIGLIHQKKLEGPILPIQALKYPPSKEFAEYFGMLTWFPITEVAGRYYWGPPMNLKMWRLPTDEHIVGTTGQIGVRDCGWDLVNPHLAFKQEESRTHAVLHMKIDRCQKHTWGEHLKLSHQPTDFQLDLKVFGTHRHQVGDHVVVRPRDWVYLA